MRLRLSGDINIEDRWSHSVESIEELRRLLAEGIEAVPESGRRGFYEVQTGFHVFYIHICPSSRVLLLAIWPAQLQLASPAVNCLGASSSASS
jgi:hypothetical protein